MNPAYSEGDQVLVVVGAWQGTEGKILDQDQACDGSHMYEVRLDENDSTWFFENELVNPHSL